MPRDYSIGTAVRQRRRALGWTLQRLVDQAGSGLSTGYLSTLETADVAPSVYVAESLAKALGTTVDALLREAQDLDAIGPPAEHTARVPLLRWEDAAQWAQDGDIRALPSGTEWILALDIPNDRTFALVVRDDQMQAGGPISFPVGYVLFVDPHRPAEPGDFVVGHLGNPKAPVFKRLVVDGGMLYLRTLNQQFPVVQAGDTFEVIGVVTGARARFEKGSVI